MRTEIMAHRGKARSHNEDMHKAVFDFQREARYRKTDAKHQGPTTNETPVDETQPPRFIQLTPTYHSTPGNRNFP